MAESRSDQEPSIEEILASIREIISDDDAKAANNAAPAAAPAPPPPPPAPEPDPVPEPEMMIPPAKEEDDILDLAAFSNKKDPLDGIDFEKPKTMHVEFTDPLPPPAPEPEPTYQPEPAAAPVFAPALTQDAVEESLLTDHAKSASLDSLSRLAQNIAISKAGQGGTLEDIVRELLRPMLRDWLDRNLPPMIERMVERELERLIKASMDR